MGRGTKTFDRLMALSGAEGSFDKLTTSSKVEGPQEYCVLVIPAKAGIEDFEPKPDNEFGRQPKFCHGLPSWRLAAPGQPPAAPGPKPRTEARA
jgi:hypothetical protein